jgi:hypothetical protein
VSICDLLGKQQATSDSPAGVYQAPAMAGAAGPFEWVGPGWPLLQQRECVLRDRVGLCQERGARLDQDLRPCEA